MKKILFLLLLALTTTYEAMSQADGLDAVANALRSGDAKSVAKFFGSTIDLTIVAKEEVYSKIQAEQVLKEFFVKNHPRSFKIIHKGASKEGAQYGIGSLNTNQGQTFRTYIYIKQSGKSIQVQELRFMKE
jgi:hypothetical protein